MICDTYTRILSRYGRIERFTEIEETNSSYISVLRKLTISFVIISRDFVNVQKYFSFSTSKLHLLSFLVLSTLSLNGI